MGFFDNLKSSLAETGQDLSQKAKDTTEIFRLTNLNKTKEKEIEKEAERISAKRKSDSETACSHNQKSERYSKRMDQLFQNRNDETIYGRVWSMAKAQDEGDCSKTMESA